jgi:hypothetical protein
VAISALESFTDTYARFQIGIQNLVKDKKPAVQQTYLELLNAPEQRTPEILESFIDAEFRRSMAEHGNEELATAYWSEVEMLASMSWDELNEMPMNERGDLFSKAREMMSAVSMQEAMIRESVYADAITTGIKMGNTVPNLARKAGVKNLERGFDVKTRMSEIEKEEQENGV